MRKRACCPFHGEKTASLCLFEDPARGWVCFGCHKGGDATAFYAEYLNLSKVEAAKQLATDFGIVYDEPKSDSKPKTSKPSEVKPTMWHLQKALEKYRNTRYYGLCDELHRMQTVLDRAMLIMAEPRDDFELAYNDRRFVTALRAFGGAIIRIAIIEEQLDFLHTASFQEVAQLYKEEVGYDEHI